jgi:non-specific serine/threonine protein kinase
LSKLLDKTGPGWRASVVLDSGKREGRKLLREPVQMDDVAGFGQALQHYRHVARLTQAELAEQAGLSEREVSDLERGLRKHPQRATVRLLIEALALAPEQAEALALAARPRPPLAQPAAVSPARHNLPAERSSFIGRRDEIARLQQVVDPCTVQASPCRLVTLTGGGGCGKTRLAIQLARRLVSEFPDGVWFVDLSPITDASLLPTLVLTAIGGRDSSDQTPLESLLQRVPGRNMLLILDNCEHLVDGCAEVSDALLDASPSLRVLATSREALRVPGEVVFRVPPLETPEPGECVDPPAMLDYAAARLFCDRACQVDLDFSLTAENTAAVADICRRLDGIPLALELAAARAATLSVQDIATRLDACFHLLTGGSRTALERHRTLRAAIDWSYDLLSPVEQTLFRRLSVFAGGWTLEAAEKVCEVEPLLHSDILDVLMRLIDQSLVDVSRDDHGSRYRFLETVRIYSAEQLQAAGEAATVQARHREWCLDLAERASEGLEGPDQFTWLQLLTMEHDNLRAAVDACALDASATETGLRLVVAMARFWFSHQPGEGRRRLAAALERASATPSSARTSALTWLTVFEVTMGDPAVGRELARQAVAEARSLGDSRRTARALRALAWAMDEDQTAERVTLLEEALVQARAVGGMGHVSVHLSWLAGAVADAGDLERARALAEESDWLGRASGDTWRRLVPTIHLGWLAMADGSLDEAAFRFQTAVDLGTGWGGYYGALGLFGLGQVSLRRGEPEHARVLTRSALLDLREVSPGSTFLVEGLPYAASIDSYVGLHERAQRLMGAYEAWHDTRGGAGRSWEPTLRSLLTRRLMSLPPVSSDGVLVRARFEGRAMTLDQAVTCALESA